VPLARSVNDLEQALLEERREYERRQRFQENQLLELNSLKAEARTREEEVRFVESLFQEYARALRARMHVIESERLQEPLAAFDAATGATDLDPAEQLRRQSQLLPTAFDRFTRLLGGDRFEASALGPRDVLERGQVVLLGPIAVFASATSDAAGLIEQELNRADPSIIRVSGSYEAGLRELAKTGAGELPLDATLGNALKIQSSRDTLWQHLMKGGVVIWPMMALALAAFIVAIVKWIEISRVPMASIMDLSKVLRLLKEASPEKALAHARTLVGPAGDLLTAAVEHADQKKEYIEEVLYEKMLVTKPRLERWLPFLALTAAASPLLGLLGTVTGMISTFNMISLFGTGDPRTMSGGISEALITTKIGLCIAIPALLVHAVLNRKAKTVLGSLEQMSVGFINGLPSRTRRSEESTRES
jgi:biopolymer transport protein ExbB